MERSRTDVRLVLTSALGRETTDRYQLTISAEDGGEPPQSGSIQVCTLRVLEGVQFLSDELSEVSDNPKLTVQFLIADFAAVSELSGKISADF